MKVTRQHTLLPAMRILTIAINFLLVLQYVLGIILNLFVNIPFDSVDLKSGSFIEKTGLAFGYARTSEVISLQLHWLNAIILALASLTLIILGAKTRQVFVWTMALALFLIFFIAAFSGAAFIGYAGSNYYSLSMAIAFIVASIMSVLLLFFLFSVKRNIGVVR